MIRNQYKDKQQAQIHCQRLHLKTLPYTLVAEQELLSVSLQFQTGHQTVVGFPILNMSIEAQVMK